MDNEVTTDAVADVSAKKRGRPVKKKKFNIPVEALPLPAVTAEAAPQVVPETPFRVETPPMERPEMRPEMRTSPREEDPRTRAARKAAEIRDHLGGDVSDGTDDFAIPPGYEPDGWQYEWKSESVLGLENAAYMVQLRRKGWEEVPRSRHPDMMPLSSKDAAIRRKGMLLMERPREINDEARSFELKKARMQVRQKEQQLNSAPDGQFGRDNKGESLAKVKKNLTRVFRSPND